MTDPVPQARIDIAKGYGLANVETMAEVCREVGIGFAATCALFEKESGGRNVYGNDVGGALAGFSRPVTEDNYAVFEWLVFAKGMSSNGVGPSQLTYKGFLTDMKAKGLRPWVVADNMRYGLQLLWGYYQASASWVTAGARYNGAQAYGVDLDEKVKQWRARFAN